MLRRAIRLVRTWLLPRYVVCDGVQLPPPHLRFCGPEFRDDRFFLRSARGEADRLVEECGVRPPARVLDVGCGPGRLAIGIIDRLGEPAAYTGIDVHRPSIEWCRRYIGARHPAFRFHHLDARNARYNPAAAAAAASTRLPADDAAFDVAYLYSVFSHMLAEDVRAYLGELHRVLVPGGALFFTGFVEEDVPDVTENPPGYRRPWSGPLHCVRYDRAYLAAMLADAGFDLVRFGYGLETDGQSAVYARRR